MQRVENSRRVPIFLVIATALASCAEPQCPDGFDKVRNVCRRHDASEPILVGDADVGQPDGNSASATQHDSSGEVGLDTGTGETYATLSDSGTSPADATIGLQPECDANRMCGTGYSCVNSKCTSTCSQTQCDANATCALVGAAPVCTCSSGFLSMASTGGKVVCLRDVACSELHCDANATCTPGSDQVRRCACKPGHSGDGMTCTAASCGRPTLANGSVSLQNGTATFGDEATFTCNKGYALAGNAKASCGADGSWSSAAPACTVVDCGAPTKPANGSVTTPTGTQFDATASYACNAGYKLQGASSARCLETKAWSAAAPSCVQACGDGVVDLSLGEACDPKSPSWDIWRCGSDCKRANVYNTCDISSTSFSCASGWMCGPNYCTVGPCTQNSECPTPPTSSAHPVCLYGICYLSDCSSNTDCPSGIVCSTGPQGNRLCMPCSASVACAAGATCRYGTDSSGNQRTLGLCYGSDGQLTR